MSGWIAVANVGDIKPGQIKTWSVDGHRILIANWEGTLFATQDVCTHDGGPLGDGELVDGEIECPRHGGRFELRTGAVAALPPIIPIKTFPVRVNGEKIEVQID